MSKALVIKQANFSANKLTTVQLIEDVPCTGISLNKSSASITDTETLVATVTPVNTTDTIYWSTSNANVATVQNGVVTATGLGTATITATCGIYTATCTVTVEIALNIFKTKGLQCSVSNNVLLPYSRELTETLPKYIGVGTTNGIYRAYGKLDGDEGLRSIYPISIPEGAKTISIGCTSDMAPVIVYYDKNSLATGSTYYDDCSEVVDGETAAGGTPWSIPSWQYGNKTYTIPSTENANSFTISFYFKTETAYNNFDVTDPGITITFGYDD